MHAYTRQDGVIPPTGETTMVSLYSENIEDDFLKLTTLVNMRIVKFSGGHRIFDHPACDLR